MSIPLTILWHQHQPYYKDLASGELILPWVRLHGIKDYYGMARLLEEFPGVHCAINLVPSMVDQLLEYTERGGTDAFLRRTATPAEALSPADVNFILDRFFMAQWERMVQPHERYRELLALRRFGRRTAAAAAADFSVQDLRDLQVWFTLAWFHPVCFQESEALRGLRAKGREFSEADKALLLAEELAVLRRVLPLHRKLAERGQVELTTTPFYHPILPLLCDMRRALEGMPKTPLPAGHMPLPEDAEAHVDKAIEFHRRSFGVPPLGMWPAEGSVSPEIVPLLARRGLQWIATDEEILGASLEHGLRGHWGRLERPELLLRPWRVHVDGAELSILFRDHQLSDLIGFQYQGWEGAAAAADLLARIEATGHGSPAGPETLVSIILDGENCWEHYPEQGVGFLRALYGRLQERQKGIVTVRPRDFLAEHRPTRYLPRLFSGSWINHDFYIWAGHAEDRKAWEYLYRVRADLARETSRRGGRPAGPPADDNQRALARAWEALYVAEGSDWFWGYGDDHTSGNDEAFDGLFRAHLKSVYQALGLPPPLFLDDPILSATPSYYSPPRAVIHPVLDGRVTTYFEWLGAGRYKASRDGGVMAAAHPPLVSQIFFGYDRDGLCVRLDPAEAAGAAVLQGVTLLFAEPSGASLRIVRGPPLNFHLEGPWARVANAAEAVWDEIIELRVPFEALGLKRGAPLAFYIEAQDATGTVERFPRAAALRLTVPPPDVEDGDWVV